MDFEKRVKLRPAEQVYDQPDQVVSMTLVQNNKVSMTIFSFDKEGISAHAARSDAMVTELEGQSRIAVADEVFFLEAGNTPIMPRVTPMPCSVRRVPRYSRSFPAEEGAAAEISSAAAPASVSSCSIDHDGRGT